MAEGLGEGFGDEMKNVSKSMQNAIPSDFDIDMNGTVSDFNEVQTQAFDVTIPLRSYFRNTSNMSAYHCQSGYLQENNRTFHKDFRQAGYPVSYVF